MRVTPPLALWLCVFATELLIPLGSLMLATLGEGNCELTPASRLERVYHALNAAKLLSSARINHPQRAPKLINTGRRLRFKYKMVHSVTAAAVTVIN